MIKVCKFGGSSIANANQYRKIKSIIDSDDSRSIIVASALGKASKDDHKVTDLLYLCIAHKKYGMSYDDILNEIKSKYQSIIDELNLDFDLNKEIDNIKLLLENKNNNDSIISKGEYLSSILLAQYLNANFVDAKDVVCFNYDGSLNIEETKNKFLPYLELLKDHKRIVVPGFYGAFPNGIIKVMDRGGSDITGSLLSNVIDAEVYENWTDVSGIYVADPRVIANPKLVDTITYSELREMSYMGANVLHDESIFPVKDKNIPINIRNTNKPEDKGTMIVSESDDNNNAVTGITGKKDFEVVSISKQGSTGEIRFLSQVFKIFDNYHVPIIMMTTSIDSYSMIIDKNSIKNNIYELVNEIKVKLNCDDVLIQDNLALVCVVGRNMRSRKGMAGKVFALLGENGINIRTISQGSDEISIIVGVDQGDYIKAVLCLYEGFVK